MKYNQIRKELSKKLENKNICADEGMKLLKAMLIIDELDEKYGEWRNIANSKYSASSKGQIKNNKTGRILKAKLNNSGYYVLNIKFGKGRFKTYSVNHLVCLAFHSEDYKKGYEADHINSIKTDNRAENLRWLSKEDNLAKRNFKKKETNNYD